MCGLVTILAPSPQPDLGDLAAQMLTRIAHRGPDGTGIQTFTQHSRVARGQPATLALAHARLAIQDTTPSGLQPMSTPSDRQHLSFNGEIYNFHELRTQLKHSGVRFRTRTDTEVALHQLTKLGPDALNHFDGMFALFFLDLDRNSLLIARDQFGIKPLYSWRAPGGQLCLASEIKAFTAHPEWVGTLHVNRSLDYLNRGLIDHSSSTLFEGVTQLPPGSLVQLDLSQPTSWNVHNWYSLEDCPTRSGPLIDELRTSVERRLRSDVLVGSCLSGGIDSSAVVALASTALHATDTSNSLIAVHARTRNAGLDESAFATLVSEQSGCQLHVIEPQGSELFDRLDELVWAQDEPFGSPSIFAQFKVFEHARRLGIKVMLDGQGADETFGGYHAFFKAALAEHLFAFRLGAARSHTRAVTHLHNTPMFSQFSQAIASLLPPALRVLGRPAPIARLEHWRDPFDTAPHGWRSVRALSLDQITHSSLPMLLHFEDRNSMHFGIEARVPFLAPSLVELALSLDATDKIDAGLTKVALRGALRSIVPDAILDRTDKVAFATPEALWMQRDPRTPQLLERGLDATRSWLSDATRHRLRAQASGALPYDNAVWRVICFGAWRERFNVGEP